jgi:membrane protein DedA with SNARE-associated domain
MSLPAFVSYTALGALLWCGILTWIGYFLGQHEQDLPQAAEVQRYASRALLILLPVMAVVVGIYVFRYRRRAASKEEG